MANFRPLHTLIALLALLLPYNGFGAENVAQGVKVIVIDAGHGGSRFPGATYGQFAEKNINLQVALKLGAMIEKNMPDVKVVYTRTTDKHFSTVLAEDLQARADIAHRNKGDLFISIHSNAHRNSEVRGVETLIMGESSREQLANQNALYLNNKEELLDMSDQKTATIVRAYLQNLQFTYGEYSEMMARLIQEEYAKLGYPNRGVRRQLLKVLYATDMPSILTEIGFMSNPTDLKHITSEKGQKEIAGAIFRAVKQYVANVNRALLLDSGTTTTTTAPAPAPKAPAPTTTPAPAQTTAPATTTITKTSPAVEQPAPKSAPQTVTQTAAPQPVKRYAIQLMASVQKIATNHPELKSYRGKVWILEGTGALRYKYCYGSFADKATAQNYIEAVRKEFPQAFIITYERE